MKKVILAAAIAVFSASFAHATPQQEKMKACNTEAGEKKGEERKKFMKECLSAKKAEDKSAQAESKMTPQQEKMKACNKDAAAKSLKGDERKKFMSDCLKG